MKKQAVIGVCIFLALAAFTARAESWDALTDAYAPVLAQYEAGLAGDEEAQLAREAVADACRCASYGEGDPLDKIGYTFIDLNGDGSPELVTGETGESGQGSGLIFEILTLRDGEPVTVLRGWERYRVALTRDPDTGKYGYCAEGSSSAYDSVYASGTAAPDMTAWENAHTLEAASDMDGGAIHWTLDGAEIGEAEAWRLIAEWEENVYCPALRPFAYQGGGRDRGFADEQTPRQEGAYCRSFQRADGVILDVVIADTGKRNPPEARWENVLSVSVTARDGSLNQQLEYSSAETPLSGRGEYMAWLDDMNFDGCPDLVLCSARGAYNEFTVFCLWNGESNCFEPVTACRPFDPETGRLGDEAEPLELVNYGTDSAKKQLISFGKNGYAAHTDAFYIWEDAGRSPRLLAVFDVYDAGDGKMGERLYAVSAQAEKLWEKAYPVDWYYGDTEPFAHHADGAAAWIDGQRRVMRVANTNWVNLRERDSKQSASLAHLEAGTEVLALKENCADGWTLVLWDSGEAKESRYEIGYIWHEFLK